jgi:hypothetical protein
MNRNLAVLSALVCLCFSTTAFARYNKTQEFRPATAEELKMTSVPGAPGAAAAILDWVRIDNDLESSTSEYLRIKIFSEEGKKHGDIELTFAPGYPLWGGISDIQARTIKPDGSIVPFAGKIYDKTVVKVGRNAVKAKTFSLPDVQPGGIIEYRYTRRWTDQYIFNTYWGVQQDIPVVHSSFTLFPYTEGDFSSMFTFVGLPAGKAPAKVGRDRYELTLENMPALRDERFAPPEDTLRARVNFYYLSSDTKADKFWEAQPAKFAKEIEGFIGKSKTADTVAKKLAAENTDRRVLLEKIYAHVQSLRNFSFESSKTEQEIKRQDLTESKNVEEVLRKGSGFGHELNRAFVAIARAAGFDADAVRVAARDEFFFSNKLPDARQMDDEIAVVDLDGKPIHLDPGTPLAPFGVVSWEKTAVAGIRVAKGGKSTTWGDTPVQDPALALTRRVADLRIEDDTLVGTITATFVGQEALLRRLRNITDDEAARKKALEDEVKGWFPDGATLTLKSLTGDATSETNLVATYDVVLPNLVSGAGSRVVVPLSVFRTTSKNPFAPTTRTHAIYFPYSNSEQDVVKLTLPEGMNAVTIPPATDMKGAVLGYSAATTRKGSEITYTRNTNVGVMLIAVENYTQIRNFFNAIASADAQQLVLTSSGKAAGGLQ